LYFFYAHSNPLDLVFNLLTFYLFPFYFCLPFFTPALKGDNFVLQSKSLLLFLTPVRTGTGGLQARGDIFPFF
jgi:hypothetical protein